MLDSNVFLVKKNGHYLIVDCGAEMSKIKEIIGNNKVDGILLTHGHYDHSLYCDDYADFYKTKIFAGEKVNETLSDSMANYSEGEMVKNDFKNFVFIKEDCKIKIGDFVVDCISAGGHSPCCECYLIEGYLFAGDVLFENGMGRTDLVGSNKKAMIETLNKLEKLSFEKVYSGHGNDSDNNAQQKNIQIFKRFLSR